MPDLTTDDVTALLDRWREAVVAGDLAGLQALYAPTAVLKPTLSTWIRRDPAGIRAYFEGSTETGDPGFLANNWKAVRITESAPQALGSVAVDTGRYVFVRANGEEVAADYTFVLQRVADGVAIVAHHSSLLWEPSAN